MEKTNELDKIMLAIQNVQQKAAYIKKESKGQVGQGKFNYANLVTTWEAVKQLLKDNQITVYQTPTSGDGRNGSGNYFKTTLFHTESSQSLTEYMPMILTRQDPQALGAAITFYRRYMLTSMLGLIPDDDNDAREQRTATAQQKLKIVGAVKMTFPEIEELPKTQQPAKINETLENIVGKHPQYIREDEADDVVELIEAYRKEA